MKSKYFDPMDPISKIGFSMHSRWLMARVEVKKQAAVWLFSFFLSKQPLHSLHQASLLRPDRPMPVTEKECSHYTFFFLVHPGCKLFFGDICTGWYNCRGGYRKCRLHLTEHFVFITIYWCPMHEDPALATSVHWVYTKRNFRERLTVPIKA